MREMNKEPLRIWHHKLSGLRCDLVLGLLQTHQLAEFGGLLALPLRITSAEGSLKGNHH